MTLEELFVEKYKALEDIVDKLEKELNKKNKQILEFEELKKDIRKNMWIDKGSEGVKYIHFFGSPCLFEKYDKEDFEKISRAFELKEKKEEEE